MAAPQGIAIAWDAGGPLTAAPDWTDLLNDTDLRVRNWSINRGRSTEFDKTGTGTASVEIIDLNGILDPTNASGPYYGKLNPMRQAAICLQNPATNAWATLFRGFVSEWFYEIDVSQKFATAKIELVDAFDLFAALELTPRAAGSTHGVTPPQGVEGDIYYAEDQQFDDRIIKLLDDVGWSGTGTALTGLRRIFSGNVALQGSIYARRDSLLSALMDAADAEFPGVANIFVDKDGKVTAHGRLARFNPGDYGSFGILSWDAGDLAAAGFDAGVAPISGLEARTSQLDIRNAVTALPKGVADTDVPSNFVKDDTSIADYGWRSESFSDLLTLHGDEGPDLNAVQETKRYADYYVDNYKDPRTRVTKIRFLPRDPTAFSGPALWALMCGVDISHVVNLDVSNPWGGGFHESYFVEGLHYEATEPLSGGFPYVSLELDVSPTAYYTTNPF